MFGSNVGIRGRYRVWHHDAAGRLLWDRRIPNGVTIEGANYLLRAFTGAPLVATWYLGLISGAVVPVLSPLDTNASHPGWAEYAGVGSTRPTWLPGAVASGQAASPANAVFGVLVSGSIAGVFLSSRQPVSDVSPSGVLFSTATGGVLPVVAGGFVTVSYLIRGEPQS